MNTAELIADIQTRTPIEARTLVHYPRILIDPCVVPLGSTDDKEARAKNRFSVTHLYCPDGLPFGHYARLQIAYLTAEIVKNKSAGEYFISRSIRKFFQICTGLNPGGATHQRFVEVLARVLATTFYFETLATPMSVLSRGRGALAYRDNLGSFGPHPQQVIFQPSEALTQLVAKKAYTPIDLRALQIFRNEDLVLAHDIYIYLCNKLFKLRGPKAFLTWSVLHKNVFTNCSHLNLNQFKQRFRTALGLIKEVYPELKDKVFADTDDGLTLRKCVIVSVEKDVSKLIRVM
ncbi:replication protein RepA [Idiomarina sp.]|uniref:replication protein RepA n=1 Tax=Idiomarina sp. TaxID=1874361 RepID=UPI0026065399|nr:replication protein RepA [Idiomarina sp.]